MGTVNLKRKRQRPPRRRAGTDASASDDALITLCNACADEAGANLAAQRIIGRLIFLRICEDRGTGLALQLRGLLSGRNVGARLRRFFRAVSGEVRPSFKIDDGCLKEIIDRLDGPDVRRFLNAAPAEILGQVYEWFLRDAAKGRKAGGVYYTPRTIVDHVVSGALGELLENQTPAEAAALRLLRPGLRRGILPPGRLPVSPRLASGVVSEQCDGEAVRRQGRSASAQG